MTISHLNTTIADHTAAANTIALCLLVSGAIVGTVGLSQNGTLTQAYHNVFRLTTATLAPVTDAPAMPQTSNVKLSVAQPAPLSLQGQPQNAVDQLQPAKDTTGDTTISVDGLQPSANSEQLTGATVQNAEGSIQ